MSYAEQLEQRALDALVEHLMDGKRYPSRTDRFGITLQSVLEECDQAELAEAIIATLNDVSDLRGSIEAVVGNQLDRSAWHQQMQDTLREDDEAAARESAMEHKREMAV